MRMNNVTTEGRGLVTWRNIPLKRSVGGPSRADFLSHVGIHSVGGLPSCKTRSGTGGGVDGTKKERWRM